MRTSWLRRVVVAGALGSTLASGSSALAKGHFTPLSGYSPTEYVAVAPTVYYLPTSYVLPTVYATSYVETSYRLVAPTTVIAPTVYTTTASVPVYSTRAYVVPTSYPYVLSTAYYDVVSAVDCSPCDVAPVVYVGDPCATAASEVRTYQAPAAGKAAPARSGNAAAGAGGTGSPAGAKPPSTLDSIPANEPEAPIRPENSAVTERPAARRANPAPGAATPPAAPTPERDTNVVPAQPAPTPITEAPENPQPAAGGAAPGAAKPQPGAIPANPLAKPPVAPDGDQLPPPVVPAPAADSDTVLREVQRPVLPALKPYRHMTRDGSLTSLQGQVLAKSTREPEAGVRISLTNRFDDTERLVTTDAQGRYAVWLPDGDWSVDVVARDGRSYTIRQLNVSLGRITDDQGRDIPSLTITR